MYYIPNILAIIRGYTEGVGIKQDSGKLVCMFMVLYGCMKPMDYHDYAAVYIHTYIHTYSTYMSPLLSKTNGVSFSTRFIWSTFVKDM